MTIYDGDVFKLPDVDRKDLFTIYEYENKYYYEYDGGAVGPFVTLRVAIQDLVMEIDQREIDYARSIYD